MSTIEQAQEWRNRIEPFQYDTVAQMLAAFHSHMLSKARATPLSEKLEEVRNDSIQ